jgi:hypothetical protein
VTENLSKKEPHKQGLNQSTGVGTQNPKQGAKKSPAHWVGKMSWPSRVQDMEMGQLPVAGEKIKLIENQQMRRWDLDAGNKNRWLELQV